MYQRWVKPTYISRAKATSKIATYKSVARWWEKRAIPRKMPSDTPDSQVRKNVLWEVPR